MLKKTSKMCRQSRPVSHDSDEPSFGILSFVSIEYNVYWLFMYQWLILTTFCNKCHLRTDSFLQESTFLKIDGFLLSRQSRLFQIATIQSLNHLVSTCVFLIEIWRVLFDLEYNFLGYAIKIFSAGFWEKKSCLKLSRQTGWS